MIDLTIHREALSRNIAAAREKGIVIPTYCLLYTSPSPRD